MRQTILSDEHLALRLKEGDISVIPLIYDRFKGNLFTFCCRLLMDQQGAEDVVHETFARLITEGSRLRDPSALKSWIYTTARNEAYAQINKGKGMRRLTDEDEQIFSGETTVETVESNERKVLLERHLDRLLPQYKEVLILREYQAMSYNEIAQITGTSVSSVKSKLFKARKALMEKLEPLRKASAL